MEGEREKEGKTGKKRGIKRGKWPKFPEARGVKNKSSPKIQPPPPQSKKKKKVL